MNPSPDVIQQQLEQLVNVVNTTTQTCFNRCARDFYTSDLSHREKQCVERCISKYMIFMTRVDRSLQAYVKSLMEKQMPQQDSIDMIEPEKPQVLAEKESREKQQELMKLLTAPQKKTETPNYRKALLQPINKDQVNS